MLNEKQAKFKIGQKFMTSGKNPRIATVTDILKTYNSAGEMVKLRYVAQYPSALNVITDYDVNETSIAMRAIN